MNKRIWISCALIGVLVFGCNKKNNTDGKKSTNADTLATVVGNDADAHGCKPSTGYQWSTLKNECIKIFEAGTQLSAVKPSLDHTSATYIVFKSTAEKAQVEVFMPNAKAVVLNKNKTETSWQNDTLILKELNGMYSLENSKKEVLYKSSK